MRAKGMLVAVFHVFLAFASGAREYPVYRMAAKPELDGGPDEAVWQQLPRAKGFFILNGEGIAWRKPTSFRMGWDDDGLYLAARCREPFKHRVNALPNDGDMLWSDDSLELFLAPDGEHYGQFLVNSVGARWHSSGSDKDRTVASDWHWQAMSDVAGDYWTAELCIPFAVIGQRPREGDTWRFNVARNAILGPAAERHSSWAPVQHGFADVPNFATLVFRGTPPPPEQLSATEQRMNEAYEAFSAKAIEALGGLIRNGTFAAGLTHWRRRFPERIDIDETTATAGSQCMRLDGVLEPGEAPVHVAASQAVTLKPGTRYILRADIKRSKFSGSISVDVIERDAEDASWTYHRCGDRANEGDVAGEWERHEIRFRTSDNLFEARVMLYNIGSDAVAWYDNLRLFEDDGSAGTATLPRAVRTILLEMHTRDASADILVNGEALSAASGEPVSAVIREGLNVIAVEASARGERPGVKIAMPEHPETDGRWRVFGQQDVPIAWMTADYNDTAWPPAAPDDGGFYWAGTDSERLRMRQVILWNRAHDGPDRCILPLIKEWGISEGSVETLWKAIYSPFPFPLEDYEFLFDIPVAFRMLDFMHENGRHVLNTRPSGFATEKVAHDGEPYTRYRIAFPKNRIYTENGPILSRYLLLPVFLQKRPGEQETSAFYYRREAKANVTELQQRIPVRILPPINGRRLSKVMISHFNAKPWRYAQISHEHLDQHVADSFRAGFNTWILSATARRNIKNDPYLKSLHDRVLSEENGRLILWNNYPYHGTREPAFDAPPQTKQFLYRWMAETPPARARFWQDSDTWETKGQWCPTYALAEGRDEFYREVLANYRLKSDLLPGSSIIWSDFEEAPWASASIYSSPADGKGSWCFCELCKENFRAWAHLPAAADLSDGNLFASYREQWHTFRSQLDGQIAALAKRAANEVGREYMIYSWMAHREFWKALRGKIDRAFPGSPGNAAADGHQQRLLDRSAAFLRDECGLDRSLVMGQRFAFFHFYAWRREHEHREFWRKWTVLSPSGYIEPKTWKPQVLRIVAAHGLGVDLHSSIQCPGGMLYWIGEATRIIGQYEDLFHSGERADELAACDTLAYPNVLVLRKGDERLVLLFNEKTDAVEVTLHNKDVLPGQTAGIFGADIRLDRPAEMRLTVPGQDVAVVHIE